MGTTIVSVVAQLGTAPSCNVLFFGFSLYFCGKSAGAFHWIPVIIYLALLAFVFAQSQNFIIAFCSCWKKSLNVELGYMDYQPIAFGFIDLLYLSSLECMPPLCFYVGTVLLEYRGAEPLIKGVCRNKYDFGTFVLYSFSPNCSDSVL